MKERSLKGGVDNTWGKKTNIQYFILFVESRCFLQACTYADIYVT